MGSIEIVKELVLLAKDAGAKFVKFQANIPIVTVEQYNKPHLVPANSYGETYGQHRNT